MNVRARLLKAISLATLAHAGQTRKGSDDPYVIHPIRVALILDDAPLPDGVCRDDCLVAAVLHDILEDTQVPQAQDGHLRVHNLIEQIPYRGQRRVPTTFLSLKITGRDNVDALHATYHSSPG